MTRALRLHGLAVRPPKRADPDKNQRIVQLFAEGVVSIPAIAERVGCNRVTVEAVLDDAGVAWRGATVRRLPPEVDREVLADLYVARRLEHAEIAARYGVAKGEVRRRLAELGVRRPRPVRVAPPAAELRALYQDEGLSLQAIRARYRVGYRAASKWLRDAGIEIRPASSTAGRRRLPVGELRRLYVEAECSAAEVGARLGTGSGVVLRALHENSLPVRPIGARQVDPMRLRWLAELYADADVTAALAAFGVPLRPQSGPLGVRFPDPGPPQVALLARLYVAVGLSTPMIELVTGVPAGRVRRELLAAGIELRPGRGASPWRRRHPGN